ncbi:MAG TPA: M1 family aminopeptidase [Candidatus Saccharimonadales bacterium]|nr:M1 family aminopeptidase [Candidatus Saccharimonadales bacterium]
MITHVRMTAILSRCSRRVASLAVLLAISLFAPHVRGDEPYARSRDYDLQHSKIAVRFDLEQKKIIGDVTHTLSILKDGTSKITFDSVGLNITSVTINKTATKFQTTSDKLIIPLVSAARAGDKFDIEIKYDGKPSKGVYFILPDKDYPDRPKQIWTQGESEDTRYYLPTYDYPNDRLTTETIITVPESFLTIANGKLVSVSKPENGMKTWTWRESLPSSTYLITIVAGELDEVKDTWRGAPVTYYAPKGRGDRLAINYGRTPAMMELFSKKLGVDYPWEKYSQAMVDDFIAGGMENSSATTNTSSSLVHPKLVPEYATGQDDLISHELGHQWFGDLVTTKDWGDIWLNEGFATFMETIWTEAHFGKEQADYSRWLAGREWFDSPGLYGKSIVRHDFDDSGEFDGNAYTKGGWVLDMLRHQLGEDDFYRGLKYYLEANRGKNAVTADLARAMEAATHSNVDQFLGQWIYGAGAPRFDIAYSYDSGKHQVALTVKQTQKVEGKVGIFRIPTDVEISTASGAKSYPVKISKTSEVFTLPSDSAPLMVLFDKGTHVLKSVNFHKEKKEWLYQLQNATELADRADAAEALAKLKNDDEVASALGEALRSDKAWGVRATAADGLGSLGSPAATKPLLDALNTASEPWIRNRIVAALGNCKNDATVAAKLDAVAHEDSSYRARASALLALGRLKTASAFATLSAAATGSSPDDILRHAALRAFGTLGDDKAVPTLSEWAAIGKPMESRTAAISSLGRLQKDNKEITRQLEGFLLEPHFPVRYAAIAALGSRGDSSAIPALEAMLKSNDLSIEMAPRIKSQIARLRKASQDKSGPHGDADEDSDEETDKSDTSARLDKLEALLREMNDRLRSIETRLPPPKP